MKIRTLTSRELFVACTLFSLAITNVHSQEGKEGPVSQGVVNTTNPSAKSEKEYWTQEEMDNASPINQTVVVGEKSLIESPAATNGAGNINGYGGGGAPATLSHSTSSMQSESMSSISTSTQEGPVSQEITEAGSLGNEVAARVIEQYWTPKRMSDAKPIEQTVVMDEESLLEPIVPSENSEPDGPPAYVRGCPPNAKNCNPVPHFLFDESNSFSGNGSHRGDGLISPTHGSIPMDPKDGPYGPFQRRREADPITAYPKSTIGKFFFTRNGSNYVCSASVVGKSTLVTAGHCTSNGSGVFSTNMYFCPSYNGSVNSIIGCWSIVQITVTSPYHRNNDTDYDYACLVTATTGSKKANKIGDITGWLGRAWNWPSSQPVRTFGYPGGAPFTGGTLQTTASTEWYTVDMSPGGPYLNT